MVLLVIGNLCHGVSDAWIFTLMGILMELMLANRCLWHDLHDIDTLQHFPGRAMVQCFLLLSDIIPLWTSSLLDHSRSRLAAAQWSEIRLVIFEAGKICTKRIT